MLRWEKVLLMLTRGMRDESEIRDGTLGERNSNGGMRNKNASAGAGYVSVDTQDAVTVTVIKYRKSRVADLTDLVLVLQLSSSLIRSS